MYTKEELESMDNAALVGIADSLGVKVTPSDEKESVIYAILDKAAENSAAVKAECLISKHDASIPKKYELELKESTGKLPNNYTGSY